MIRRVVITAGLALLLATTAASGAAAPEGPRLAIMRLGPGAYFSALETVDPSGENRQTLFRSFRRTRPALLAFETPSWSPDGSAIAFSGLTGHFYDDGSRIFVVDAAGGVPRPLPGTEGGRDPVLSPDGKTVAFVRIRSRERVVERPGEVREHVDFNASVWTVGLDGSSPRRFTPLGFGVEYFPSSFSPDGSVLVATRILNGGPPALVGLESDGSGLHLIARHAAAGVLSPDGTRIAYLHQGRKYEERDRGGGRTTGRTTDLFVRDIDGSHSLRLTHTPKGVELGASWDPSGERLAFAQLGRARSLFETGGIGDEIVQINADGTCRTKVLSLPSAILLEPVWQPGPGREAGRIVC